jgi:hypothetical protein
MPIFSEYLSKLEDPVFQGFDARTIFEKISPLPRWLVWFPLALLKAFIGYLVYAVEGRLDDLIIQTTLEYNVHLLVGGVSLILNHEFVYWFTYLPVSWSSSKALTKDMVTELQHVCDWTVYLYLPIASDDLMFV